MFRSDETRHKFQNIPRNSLKLVHIQLSQTKSCVANLNGRAAYVVQQPNLHCLTLTTLSNHILIQLFRGSLYFPCMSNFLLS